MLKNGYIKLYRSLLEWEWYDDTVTKCLFLHLLLTVNAYDEDWKGIVIKRGSRVSSYTKLSEELHFTIKQIRTGIQHLERTGEVARTAYPRFTVFTVTNYDAYQTRGQAKGQAKGTQPGRQGAGKGQQSKNIEEYKEEKKENVRASGAKTPERPTGEKSIFERMRE